MTQEYDLSHYDGRIEALIRRNGMERSVLIGESIGEFLVGTWELFRRAAVATARGYAQWRASTDDVYARSPRRDLPFLE